LHAILQGVFIDVFDLGEDFESGLVEMILYREKYEVVIKSLYISMKGFIENEIIIEEEL
jgi:hypothetical protein